jgi:hypothetical protein
MQRAQSDDKFRHAGLRSDPLILKAADRCRRRVIHAPKRIVAVTPRDGEQLARARRLLEAAHPLSLEEIAPELEEVPA